MIGVGRDSRLVRGAPLLLVVFGGCGELQQATAADTHTTTNGSDSGPSAEDGESASTSAPATTIDAATGSATADTGAGSTTSPVADSTMSSGSDPDTGESTADPGSTSLASTGEPSGTTGQSCDANILVDLACAPECDACEAGVCVLDCTGEQTCAGDTVTCPTGDPCRVDCIGEQACKQATIECPPDQACTVVCDGEQACQQFAVECGDGPCALECGPAGGDQVCDEATMQCGASDGTVTCATPQATAPMLEPSGSGCACEALGC